MPDERRHIACARPSAVAAIGCLEVSVEAFSGCCQ